MIRFLNHNHPNLYQVMQWRIQFFYEDRFKQRVWGELWWPLWVQGKALGGESGGKLQEFSVLESLTFN